MEPVKKPVCPPFLLYVPIFFCTYLIDYVDGTHATLLMLDGALADFNFAAWVRGMSERAATDLTPMGLRPMIGYDRTNQNQGS